MHERVYNLGTFGGVAATMNIYKVASECYIGQQDVFWSPRHCVTAYSMQSYADSAYEE